MQDNIPDALIAAFERQYGVSFDHPDLRNERLAMRYGWTAAMEQKQCVQISEPVPVQAAIYAATRRAIVRTAAAIAAAQQTQGGE